MKKTLMVCFIIYISLSNSFITAQNKEAKVESTKLGENIYKLELNNIVNIIAFVGADGVLLVDDGFDKNHAYGFINSPSAIKAELKKLGNDNIKYIINTHTDIDHAYGNSELGQGSTVIAHQLGRERLLGIAKFPKEGLPNLTFQDSLHLYFNNEEINIFHLPGHTNHDIIIHFKNAKIVCVGDLIIPDSFGSISQTGNVYSMIKAIDHLYNRFTDDVTFIAGHDRAMNRKDLLIYKNMIEETLDILVKEVNKGKSPEEMMKDDVLKNWEKWNGVLFKELDANMWIMMIFKSISNKHSAAEKISALLNNSNYEAAKPEIQLIITQKEKYYLLEAEFNILGYNLINLGKLADAIEIFKITVDMYPESWNAYDSLGEAYMNAGNKELAVKNYEKSLELNSQNTNAVEQLKKLNEKEK